MVTDNLSNRVARNLDMILEEIDTLLKKPDILKEPERGEVVFNIDDVVEAAFDAYKAFSLMYDIINILRKDSFISDQNSLNRIKEKVKELKTHKQRMISKLQDLRNK